jgi:hypothetical protein
MIFLKDRGVADLLDAILDYIHDVSFSILVLILMNVEFEVEHCDEGVGHLAHHLTGAFLRQPVEYGLLLVSVEVELCGQSHRSEQNAFGILLCDFSPLFAGEISSGLHQTLNVDQGGDNQVDRCLLEALEKEADERLDLHVVVPELPQVEDYRKVVKW